VARLRRFEYFSPQIRRAGHTSVRSAAQRSAAATGAGFLQGELAPEPLCQSRDEAVGIGLVVEHVGRDAHAAKTRGDVDAFGG
jgi:hypothetical protein